MKKAEEYAPVIRSLKKGKSIRDTAKLCDVSISTVQRVKREFATTNIYPERTRKNLNRK